MAGLADQRLLAPSLEVAGKGRAARHHGRHDKQGQSEFYLINAMKAYKSGERKNDMMSSVAPALSQKDIEDLAAYFAAIKFTIEPNQ